MGHFLKFLLNLLQYCFRFLFWFCFGREARGILTLRPAIKPTAPAFEGSFLTTRLPGKSLVSAAFNKSESLSHYQDDKRALIYHCYIFMIMMLSEMLG